MASLYNADLKSIDSGITTHPYDHATKLFLSDNYRLAPKQSFLYYVCINIDIGTITASSILKSLIAPDGTSSQTLIEQYETGLLAKRVELPKFTIGTKTMNAYNRKNIVQTNISYDPIAITFHDDAADVVNTFWNDYYTYYYRDSDYNPTLYQLPHKYQPRNREGWGFTPRNNSVRPFLRNIQIFSLHNRRFTEYLLINPFINRWRHGEHDSTRGDGIMESVMEISYEAVKYRTGYVNPVDVNGFSLLHYDTTPSPISNGDSSVFTDAIISGAVNGATKDLARPDGTGSGVGVLGSILNAYKFYNTSKQVNVGGVAKQVLGQIAGQVINGAVNGAINNVFFPTVNGTGGYGSSYGSSQVYANTGILQTNPYGSPANSFLATIGQSAAGQVVGSIIQTSTTAIDRWVRGTISGQTAPLPGNPAVYQVQTNNGIIQVNSQGQPITGQSIAFIQSADGEQIVGELKTIQTSSGTFNQTNLTENLKYATLTKDESGNPVTEYVYFDGTKVLYDDERGGIQQVYPGTNYGNTISAPTNTRDQVIAGQPVNAGMPQTYTDPRTGIIYTTGGTTGAYITNTITGTAGLIGGAYIGQGINQALNGTFLGKSVIGQAVSGAISSYVGLEVGRVINNGLQPIVNNITGSISQGWDSVTGSIKNVVGSWTGTGRYDPASPTSNIVNKVSDGEGGFIITDKTGSVTYTDSAGAITGYGPQTQISGSNWFGLGSTAPGINSDTNATYSGYITDRWGNPISVGSGGYLTGAGTGELSSSVGPLWDSSTVSDSLVGPDVGYQANEFYTWDSDLSDPGFWT